MTGSLERDELKAEVEFLTLRYDLLEISIKSIRRYSPLL